MPSYGAEFGAKVYKIAEDNQGNRLTFMKITGGSLQVSEVLQSEKNTNAEKVNRIRIYSGEKFTCLLYTSQSECKSGCHRGAYC